jgi:hypothetical protein
LHQPILMPGAVRVEVVHIPIEEDPLNRPAFGPGSRTVQRLWVDAGGSKSCALEPTVAIDPAMLVTDQSRDCRSGKVDG